MTRNNYSAFVTKLVMIGALAEFVIVEVLIVVTFLRHPNPHLVPTALSVFVVCLLASIPAVAGVRGYFIVNRLLMSPSDLNVSALRLSRLFVGGMAGAFSCVVFILIFMSR